MTRERAVAAVPALESALWLQNERIYQQWRDRMPWRPQLRVAAMALSAVGLLLAVIGGLFATQLLLLYVATAGLFVAFFLVFWYVERLAAAIRAGTRQLVARQARRALLPVIRRAPYTIGYEIESDDLRIAADAVGVEARVPLSRVQLAVVAPGLMCLYDRPFSQRLLRVVYFSDEDEEQALTNILIEHGASVLKAV